MKKFEVLSQMKYDLYVNSYNKDLTNEQKFIRTFF